MFQPKGANAERSIDPFHVVTWANDSLDEARKQAVRKAKKEGAAEGRSSSSKKQEDPVILKYALLKNPENLTNNQRVAIEMLIKSDSCLNRAYLIVDGLGCARI